VPFAAERAVVKDVAEGMRLGPHYSTRNSAP
jgi:hypothetical protein